MYTKQLFNTERIAKRVTKLELTSPRLSKELAHPLKKRIVGYSCSLTLDEQRKLPLSNASEQSFWVLVKDGELLKGNLVEGQDLPEPDQDPAAIWYVADLKGNHFSNWRRLNPEQ